MACLHDSVFSAEQFQILLANLPSGCIITNEQRRIIYANKYAETLLGYPESALSDVSIDEVLAINHPTSLGPFPLNNTSDSSPQHQCADSTTLTATTALGGNITVEASFQPMSLEGRIMTIISLNRLNNANTLRGMLDTLISSAPHGVALVDSSGAIRNANATLCQAFGYPSNEILALTVEDLLPERYRLAHHAYRAKIMQAPAMRVMGPGRDLSALHKEGFEFPVEVGLSPLPTEIDGNLTLVTVIDISERKIAEQSLRNIKRNLEEFSFVASHDLRVPLRGIGELIQWVREDLGESPAPVVSANIDRIILRFTHMESLIDNLLSYARTSQDEEVAEQIEINTLFSEIIALTPVPDNFDIQLTCRANTINAVKTPLATVLRNLISNAIKHNDKDHGKLDIIFSFENDFILIVLRDNGPGLPESVVENIFSRLQTTGGNQFNNAGIGLAISRRIIEAHGGSVTVENNISAPGCTFKVRWPSNDCRHRGLVSTSESAASS